MGSAIFAKEIRPVGATTFFDAVREAANSGPSEVLAGECYLPVRMLNGPFTVRRVDKMAGAKHQYNRHDASGQGPERRKS
jgi:hypothetical protein